MENLEKMKQLDKLYTPSPFVRIFKILPWRYLKYLGTYPVCLEQMAQAYRKPNLPAGYVPDEILIYYTESEDDNPDVIIEKGELKFVRVRDEDEIENVTIVVIDDHCAYGQIHGQVILNRLGGAVLPNVLVDHKLMLNTILENLPQV
jgi:hypothetical protein